MRRSTPPSKSAVGLDLIGVAQIGEGDLAERGKLRARTDASGNKARAVSSRKVASHLDGELRGAPREFRGAFCDLILGEHDGKGAKRVGFDDVDADLEERAVQVLDDVGPRHDEGLVATLERRASEVVRPEAAQLQVRPGRPVEDDDALVEKIQVAGHESQG